MKQDKSRGTMKNRFMKQDKSTETNTMRYDK